MQAVIPLSRRGNPLWLQTAPSKLLAYIISRMCMLRFPLGSMRAMPAKITGAKQDIIRGQVSCHAKAPGCSP